MNAHDASIRQVAIVARSGSTDILEEGKTIQAWLKRRGVLGTLTNTDDPRLRDGINAGEYDLLIALGRRRHHVARGSPRRAAMGFLSWALTWASLAS